MLRSRLHVGIRRPRSRNGERRDQVWRQQGEEEQEEQEEQEEEKEEQEEQEEEKEEQKEQEEQEEEEETEEEDHGVDAHFFFCGFQVCMNFECRVADVLNYDCDVENKCHGHGVRHAHLSVCLSGVSLHLTLTCLPVCLSVCLSVRCITSSDTHLSVCLSVSGV